MNLKNTLPISEARKKIFDIAEDVQKPGTYYVLTDKGRPKAVMLSYEEYDSLIETLEVYKEFPDLQKNVDELHSEVKTGAYNNYPTLEEVMAEYGFVVAEKNKSSYGIPNHTQAKRKKRAK